jgi:hypothetical protein
MAIGSVAAFIILYSIILFAYIYTHDYPKKICVFLFGLFILFVPFIIFYNEIIFNSSIILSKIDTSSQTFQTAVNQITWMLPDNFVSIWNYAFDVFLWTLILTMFFVSINGIIYRKFVDVNSLALLYLIIHSMKGSQESVFMLIYAFFWFYVSYYDIKYR